MGLYTAVHGGWCLCILAKSLEVASASVADRSVNFPFDYVQRYKYRQYLQLCFSENRRVRQVWCHHEALCCYL